MSSFDYYQVLGVEQDAGQQKIKEAYRKLALRYHPDRNKDNPQAAERMKILNEAYAVLSDHEKRQQYDSLRNMYGDDAYSHFRQSFSEQDIFSQSDIYNIFEEMARSFGLRGFDEIFKEFYGASFKVYDFSYGGGARNKSGAEGKGNGAHKPVKTGLMEKLARKAFSRLTGIEIPIEGKDIHDVIRLDQKFAAEGGPFPYYHKQKDKKLVVKVPAGITEGKVIRLAAMGHPGRGGGKSGDLLLKVCFKRPVWQRLKKKFGFS